MVDCDNLEHIATIVGGFATGLAAVIAAVAIIIGINQIRSNFVATRESGALQAHRDYLKICFENPKYSSTELFLKCNSEIEISQIIDHISEESEKYLWFLSILLNTSEQIISFVSSKDEWKIVISDNLKFHSQALKVVWPTWSFHYADPIKIVVDEIIQ